MFRILTKFVNYYRMRNPVFDVDQLFSNYFLNKEYSVQEIDFLKSRNFVVDGDSGGYLLGPPHELGGIKVLHKYSNGYKLAAEFEGGEYLLNPGASKLCLEELRSINNWQRDKVVKLSFPPAAAITTLNCFRGNNSKFLILDTRAPNFFIVNKYSSAIFYKRLEELNSKYKFEFWGVQPEM